MRKEETTDFRTSTKEDQSLEREGAGFWFLCAKQHEASLPVNRLTKIFFFNLSILLSSFSSLSSSLFGEHVHEGKRGREKEIRGVTNDASEGKREKKRKTLMLILSPDLKRKFKKQRKTKKTCLFLMCTGNANLGCTYT